MPWLSQVAAVVDAWYPGESNGTALASVLFGQVDPSGHLPVTFPEDLSQVPASSPAAFPGVNGEVQYSEGIDVGYRYYDASNETPMFPFGYGLSYTNFSYSHLAITPQQVENTASNPGPTSCGCNGQSSRQVTVSATVTNTGKVAGSDVAQLYLGDPASAGEPPRQLKGFQKVTLQPGQSTTVRFGLTGHDLSYWDSAASGWVLPDGRYGVYVGDSSALAGLPLRGGFGVTRSVGARYATVSAPLTVSPGSSATVNVTVVNQGDYALPDARFSVGVPDGWSVASPAPVTVGAGQTVTRSVQVRVPAGAQPGTVTLTAKVTAPGGPGGRPSLVVATTTVAVAAASLSAAYNNTGISDNADESAADYDGSGDSFSAQALAAATPTALTPGTKVTIGGTTFTWPDVAAGTPDNVVASGQSIALSGSGTDLGFLGSSQNGTATGTVTVHYTDGSTTSTTLNMADWYANAAAVGNQLLTTTSSWNFQSNSLGAHPVSLYFASVPLAKGKTVASVTLPTLSTGGGTTAMHIFAMAIGSGTPTVGAPYSSVAAAYDNVGISDNSDPAAADFDGTGESFSAQALAAATPHGTEPGPGHGGRDHLRLARHGRSRQRDRGRADHRRVRIRDRTRLPGRRGVRRSIRQRHHHLHRWEHAVVQPEHGRLVQQRRGHRGPDRRHHLQLELLQQHADRPPGQHLLRLRAAAPGQDGGVGDPAHGEQRRGERGERDAHLRDSHRVRHGDGLRWRAEVIGRSGLAGADWPEWPSAGRRPAG